MIAAVVEVGDELSRHVNGDASLSDTVSVPLCGQPVRVLETALQAEDGVHDPQGRLPLDLDRHGRFANFLLIQPYQRAEKVDD